jgi:predicted transcriptional regulator
MMNPRSRKTYTFDRKYRDRRDLYYQLLNACKDEPKGRMYLSGVLELDIKGQTKIAEPLIRSGLMVEGKVERGRVREWTGHGFSTLVAASASTSRNTGTRKTKVTYFTTAKGRRYIALYEKLLGLFGDRGLVLLTYKPSNRNRNRNRNRN